MNTRRIFLRGTASGALAAVAGLPGVAAAAPPEETGSDLGSLYPFVRSQAVAGEFPLSFLQPRFTDLAAWKREARGRLLDLLHYAPPAADFRAETVARVDRGDYVQETVYFNTTPDIRVPAFVLLPKRGPRPAPALVALHDHGGFYLWGKEKLVAQDDEHPVLSDFKRQYYSGRSIASDLARAGYVVIVIDMFYWGERRLLLDADPADWRERPRSLTPERISAFNRRAWENEQLLARSIYAAGFTWAGVMYWDDIRTVDYLASRPEVDPARIGCVGLSMGGLRTIHLAALDERIKAAVAVGWMTSFPPQLARKISSTIGFTKLVPGLYQQLDYPDVASLAAPTPLLVINGRKDALFELSAVEASFQKLGAVYAKAGAPDHVRTRFYDTPHEFNAEMQTEAWAWLARHLSSPAPSASAGAGGAGGTAAAAIAARLDELSTLLRDCTCRAREAADLLLAADFKGGRLTPAQEAAAEGDSVRGEGLPGEAAYRGSAFRKELTALVGDFDSLTVAEFATAAVEPDETGARATVRFHLAGPAKGGGQAERRGRWQMRWRPVDGAWRVVEWVTLEHVRRRSAAPA